MFAKSYHFVKVEHKSICFQMIALREGVAGRCSLKKSSFNFLSKILRKTPPMKVLFSTVKDLVLNHQLTCYSVFMSLFVVISYFFIIVMRYWFYIFFIISQYTLIHFMPLVSFYTPSKHQKTYGFLMFSGGVERDQWHELG